MYALSISKELSPAHPSRAARPPANRSHSLGPCHDRSWPTTRLRFPRLLRPLRGQRRHHHHVIAPFASPPILPPPLPESSQATASICKPCAAFCPGIDDAAMRQPAVAPRRPGRNARHIAAQSDHSRHPSEIRRSRPRTVNLQSAPTPLKSAERARASSPTLSSPSS